MFSRSRREAAGAAQHRWSIPPRLLVLCRSARGGWTLSVILLAPTRTARAGKFTRAVLRVSYVKLSCTRCITGLIRGYMPGQRSPGNFAVQSLSVAATPLRFGVLQSRGGQAGFPGAMHSDCHFNVRVAKAIVRLRTRLFAWLNLINPSERQYAPGKTRALLKQYRARNICVSRKHVLERVHS